MNPKNNNLNLTKSPYSVKYSNRVAQAVKYSLEKGLLNKHSIDKSIISNYLKNKAELPLWIVEAVCKTNLKHTFVPAQYQHLWFCLHNTILTRKQPSGREFHTKVNFAPCYIALDKRLKELLYRACKTVNLPAYKFIELCGYKKGDNKDTISILTLLKICQILRIDVWELSQGYEFFGKTNKTGKIIIPKDKKDVDLLILLTWLRTEGHIELGSTHIEINQMNNIKSLIKVKEILVETFDLDKTKPIFSKGNRGEDRLIISSSPLKQLLCLRYGFPLGYKSGSLLPLNLSGLSTEDYKRIMPAFIQTEGCLSYQYTRNKKKKLPRFEFIVKDKALAEDCIFVLKKLRFNPNFKENQNLFKVGLYNSNDVISLVNQTRKHFFDNQKLDYLREKCTDGIGL